MFTTGLLRSQLTEIAELDASANEVLLVAVGHTRESSSSAFTIRELDLSELQVSLKSASRKSSPDLQQLTALVKLVREVNVGTENAEERPIVAAIRASANVVGDRLLTLNQERGVSE